MSFPSPVVTGSSAFADDDTERGRVLAWASADEEASAPASVVVELADVMLGVELEAELADEIELGLEEVDVTFLGVHELFEQVAGHVVLHRVAMGRGLLIEGARGIFGRKVAVEHLLDVLADMQRVEHLQVGEAVEEDHSLDDLVGVLHLLHRFLAPLLGQGLVAPIVQQPIMQPVLVDRGQLMPQAAVEIFDDFCVALPGPLPWLESPLRPPPFTAGQDLERLERGLTRQTRQGVNARRGRCFQRFEWECRSARLAAVRMAAAIRSTGGECLVHDSPNGTGAPPTLSAAAKAPINLARGARSLARTESRAHVAIGQHVTGTDDHESPASPSRFGSLCNYRYFKSPPRAKGKDPIYSYSKLGCGTRGPQPTGAFSAGGTMTCRPAGGPRNQAVAWVSTAIMPSTTSSISALSLPSPMTRMTGSVPERRTIR